MIIDCTADLHGSYPELKGGDLLIVAGDLTARDTEVEYMQLVTWLESLSYDKIIVIAGNHDGFIESNGWQWKDTSKIEYLQDSGTEFKGFKIWGTPWTPEFCNWHFMLPRNSAEIGAKWVMIPDDTDILVTHGPAWSVLDSASRGASKLNRVGCQKLYEHVYDRVKPKLHVFGHIHEGYGSLAMKHQFCVRACTLCVNAAYMDRNYEPVNEPIRVKLNERGAYVL